MKKEQTKKENYEDFSSGRVLYGAPGATNFPVSLTREIFGKCYEYLKSKGNEGPYFIYDPFCGAAYLLTVLGFLYEENIKEIFGSDVDTTILQFAKKNLSLLNKGGIDKRKNELIKFIKEYKKDSHKEALESAERLNLKFENISIPTVLFEFNMISEAILPKFLNNIDVVIADVPYGILTDWNGLREGVNPIQVSLDKIKNRLNKISIVAIVLNKKQKISYEGYTKIKSLKIGKRKVILLTV